MRREKSCHEHWLCKGCLLPQHFGTCRPQDGSTTGCQICGASSHHTLIHAAGSYNPYHESERSSATSSRTLNTLNRTYRTSDESNIGREVEIKRERSSSSSLPTATAFSTTGTRVSITETDTKPLARAEARIPRAIRGPRNEDQRDLSLIHI